MIFMHFTTHCVWLYDANLRTASERVGQIDQIAISAVNIEENNNFKICMYMKVN